MIIKELTAEDIPGFRNFFEVNAKCQDESFPPPKDYFITPEEPVYLLTDDEGNITGAAALMLHKAYRNAKTGRFRMFYCINNEIENYKLLFDKILPHTHGLNDIYCFVDEKFTDTRRAWEEIGFKVKRYSWILKRDTENFSLPGFPDGYELKPMISGWDEIAWCDIINESFAGMQGHVHLYPDKLEQWRRGPGHIDNGLMMLWHNKKPVGTIAFVKDTENGEDIIFIEAISLLKSYQGRGLGKNLLRTGIQLAKNCGVKHTMLSVNAENERAADLYIKEGFNKEALIYCYSYKINN
jgi:mycothiol synthase